MTRAKCPACTADEKKITPGEALAIGLAIARHTRAPLCRSHAQLQSKHETELKPQGRHTAGGNCLRFKCDKCGPENVCDVCHVHEQPRGECDECPPCVACQRENKP